MDYLEDRENIVFLDLETTGLDPEKDEIMEIGATRSGGVCREEFERLVRIQAGEVSEEVSRITGITAGETKKNGVPLETALEELDRFAGKSPLFIGHNIDFDLEFLSRAGFEIKGDRLDTAMVAALLWPDRKSYRLSSLVPGSGAHRALADAMHCRRLFEKLRQWAIDYPEPALLEEMAGLLSAEEPVISACLASWSADSRSRAAGDGTGQSEEPPGRLGSRPAGNPRRAAREAIGQFFAGKSREEGIPVSHFMESRDSTLSLLDALLEGGVIPLPQAEETAFAHCLAALAAARAGAGPILLNASSPRHFWRLWDESLREARAGRIPGKQPLVARLLPPAEYLCRECWAEFYEKRKKLAENRYPLAYLLSFSRQSREGLLPDTASFLYYRYPVLKEWRKSLNCESQSCPADSHLDCFYRRALERAAAADLLVRADCPGKGLMKRVERENLLACPAGEEGQVPGRDA